MDNGKVNVPVDTGTSKDTTPSEVTKPPKKEGTPQLATVRQVFSFANTAKIQWYIIGSFCAAITSGAILPASIFYFAVALQDLAADTDSYDFRATIREISFAFMVFGVLLFASMTIQSSLMEMAAAEMTHELKTSWFAAIMRQDMAYFDAKDVSGDATIITINGAKYKKGVGRKLAESLQFFVSFVGSLAYSFWASWQTSLVTLLITPVMFASSLFLLKMNKSQTLRANATYAKAGSIVNMAVTSLRTILSLNAVERVIEMYQEATAEACQGAVSQVWLVGLATGCQLGSFLLSYVVITLFGSYLLFDNVRDSGCDPSGTTDGVPACDPSGADVFGALMGVTVAAFVLPQVSVALDAFIEKVSSSYVIDSSSDRGVKLPSLIGDLEFRSVRFSYPTRDADVFRNFSLQIPSGKTVALVGPSGCGKSTAMQLLERFYDPLDGTLTLDGVDLREINVKWLRQQIGLVSQEPKLFAMSIRDNIAIGSPNASQGDIERAASMANAYDFIQSFPQGFDTIVGEEGAQLSGGQRQRIALARVLVRNVKILLLDEATSALDSEILADGIIAEIGNHQELLDKRGRYFALVEAQKLKTTEPVVHISQSIVKKDSPAEAIVRTKTSTSVPPLISFCDVAFQYPSRPDSSVFHGLDLDIRQGETLALVGPSGSGKSTIMQLLELFYHPKDGKIEFNGVDIRDLNVRWVREQFGLVSQEPVLFDTTIMENIRYSFPEASEQQVEEAAKKANAHDFIISFPDGYKTRVGAGSTLVSGGQKQRIAIARALLKKPKVLLLDEATSALDSQSEAIVQSAIDDLILGGDQTCIVIAHRLSTIRNADRIAVIDQGKVGEIGTHDDLMALNGQYARLQALQNLGTTEEVALVSNNAMDENTETEKTLSSKNDAPPETDTIDEIDEDAHKRISKRVRSLASDDSFYFVAGAIGAVFAGIMFPAWGFIFAYMIELFYTPVQACPPLANDGFFDCDEYFDFVADDIQERSMKIFYGFIGIIVSSVFGTTLLFWGFGSASERMNKRVRDGAFKSLLRQEVAWFDVRSPGTIKSQLADDAALLHAFCGEPIRTLVLSLASVLVGLIVSFIYMWPIALSTLFILPFMAFGAEMEMKTYAGEDEGDEDGRDKNSAGGIVIESLSNMRTVASLTLEEQRAAEYAQALRQTDYESPRVVVFKGSAAGAGQFVQMW
ncbi:predicted protein, partial [Phaeodactylum tricornutum CCAP 1055/1]